MTEKIGVSFDKRVTQEAPVEYWVKIDINTTVTDPTVLDTCLLISPGDGTHDERVARVAVLDELLPTETYPALPALVNKFSCTTYDMSTVSPGDTLQIREESYPKAWSLYYGFAGDIELEVVNVVGDIVTVTPGVPTCAIGLTFMLAEYGEDSLNGIMSRDYGGQSTYYRAASHVDCYVTADAATTAIAARKAEFASLISETKEIGFSGVDTQLYE